MEAVKTVLQFNGDPDRELVGPVIPAKSDKAALSPKKKKKPVLFIENTDFNGKQLALDIIAKREKDNLTLAVAAKAVGCGASVLWTIEARSTCSVGWLPYFCNWLQRPVQYYFTKNK